MGWDIRIDHAYPADHHVETCTDHNKTYVPDQVKSTMCLRTPGTGIINKATLCRSPLRKHQEIKQILQTRMTQISENELCDLCIEWSHHLCHACTHTYHCKRSAEAYDRVTYIKYRLPLAITLLLVRCMHVHHRTSIKPKSRCVVLEVEVRAALRGGLGDSSPSAPNWQLPPPPPPPPPV